MKKILFFLALGLVLSVCGEAGPQLKVKPHSKYGFPLVSLNKNVIIGFTLQIYGKKNQLLARQSPYARGVMNVDKFKTTGDRTVVMGSFSAGESLFGFVETIQKEANGDYLITYLVTPRQDSAIVLKIEGVISSKEIFALKQAGDKIVEVPGKKKTVMPSLKFKDYIEMIPAIDKIPVFFIPVSGIGLIQTVDKKKWNMGIRLELFSKVTGWKAGKVIHANEMQCLSLRISLKKPEPENNESVR